MSRPRTYAVVLKINWPFENAMTATDMSHVTVCMPDINKDDMMRVFGVRKVGFDDTISKSCSCCIVDQAKDVEIDDSVAASITAQCCYQ
jgi:hypothetical protein